MCNEYARMITLNKAIDEMRRKQLPPVTWADGRIPNDMDGKVSVRIRDSAPIFRLREGTLVGAMTTWAWKGSHGKPVFNFVSEKRDFAHSDRVLILATGFYEYTTPGAGKIKLKDRHLFSLSNDPWFWIAGIVKEDCFTMLTVAPGPDVASYHDRQIVTLPPGEGLDWLTLGRPQLNILSTPTAGTFHVTTLRKNGVDLRGGSAKLNSSISGFLPDGDQYCCEQ